MTATQGQVMVTSRTYNDQPTGTYGQFVPGAPVSVAFGQGRVQAASCSSAYSPDPKLGFRTNIGLVNASALTIAVSTWTSTGATAPRWAPGAPRWGRSGPIQLNDVFSTVTPRRCPTVSRSCATTTAGGAFFAYASVIDNRSGDPIYIPARVAAP